MDFQFVLGGPFYFELGLDINDRGPFDQRDCQSRPPASSDTKEKANGQHGYGDLDCVVTLHLHHLSISLVGTVICRLRFSLKSGQVLQTIQSTRHANKAYFEDRRRDRAESKTDGKTKRFISVKNV